jgi:glycosyltransferase involved in cell wall biosynthesis
MKIAMLMSVFGQHAVGGAERCAERVARGLVQRGHQVDLVALGAASDGIQTRQWEPGLSLTSVGLFQLYDPYRLSGQPLRKQGALARALWHGLDVYNPVMRRRLDEVWSNLKPDLVVTHTLQGFSVSAWASALQSGAKLVHVLHDHSLLCPGTAMSRGTRVCDQPCRSCATYGAARQQLGNGKSAPHGVIAPSQDVLQRHVYHGWFTEVPMRQVIENVLPPTWPAADVSRFQQHQDTLKFAFVGRLDESKGLDTLLQAAALLIGKPCEVHIGGVGSEADEAAAREFIKSKGLSSQVFLHGRVDTASFLSDKHVMVAPSRARETFNMVVLEAAACGLPSIVADRGALPERVGNGKSGWVFPVGDSEALARQMIHCLTHQQDVRDKSILALQQAEHSRKTDEIGMWEAFCQQVLTRPENAGSAR